MKIIETENGKQIILRAPEPSDIDMLFALENDTDMWGVSSNVIPYSRHQLERYIVESSHDLYTDRQIRFVIHSLAPSIPIGCIDLTDIDPYNDRAEVGIAILEQYRGEGVASAALAKLCSYAKDMVHLHQLFAYVPADNEASLKLFHSAGFEQAGMLKDWLHVTDGYKDVVILQKIL
ncbi:MAG: GNAT family N-acetyltransferase [Bacteroidaceae bacterium]|nr:GNAT family N-acetyltransferase [Bacteroidaceae bacterium]